MHKPNVDRDALAARLLELFAIPSPSGFTDAIVRHVCAVLERLEIPFELTRRGAIRADLKGARSSPDRALVVHLDTIGAMVRQLKSNGRLGLSPIGGWSSRFAAGARVTIFSDDRQHRGTILPLKASGHTYGDAVDSQPTSWQHVEVRVDEDVGDAASLAALDINVGDYVAVDPQPEITDSGFVVSRHLDNKGGIACLLAAAALVRQHRLVLPVDCHLLFTIFEEVGSGASAVLHQDVAEMVSIDGGTSAPGQNTVEREVTVGMMDSSGPFDYHLSHKLLQVAADHGIPVRRDVFRYYRTDAASAVEAGNDIRTALLCFGMDASHGWERTHLDGLCRLTELLVLYMQSPPVAERDRVDLGPLQGLPRQPV
jgi:peptidase M42 family hydrolase